MAFAKIGIAADVIATGILKRRELHAALGPYTSKRMYLKAIAAGGPMFDLDGMPTGDVSRERPHGRR